MAHWTRALRRSTSTSKEGDAVEEKYDEEVDVNNADTYQDILLERGKCHALCALLLLHLLYLLPARRHRTRVAAGARGARS